MMMFMRTFSFLILIVFFTLSGAYILNTHTNTTKQANIQKHDNLTIKTPHHETASEVPLTFFIQQAKLDSAKTKMNTQAELFIPKKESSPKPAKPRNHSKENSSTTKKETPTPSSTQPVDDNTDDNNADDNVDDQTIDTPVPAIVVVTPPAPDPNQEILKEQCEWLVTNLGAIDSQLPTTYVPVNSLVANPDPIKNFDGTEIITFDKTITGDDYSIRYVVADGVLYIDIEGNVPKELIPPGL